MVSWQNERLAKWQNGKMASWQIYMLKENSNLSEPQVDKMAIWWEQIKKIAYWWNGKLIKRQLKNDKLTKWQVDKMAKW